MVGRLGEAALQKQLDGMIPQKMTKVNEAKETVKPSKYDKSKPKPREGEPTRYKCPHCPFFFKTYDRRLRHIKEHKRDPIKYPFSCSLCNVRFQTKGALTTHLIDSHIKRGDNYVGAGTSAAATLDLQGRIF